MTDFRRILFCRFGNRKVPLMTTKWLLNGTRNSLDPPWAILQQIHLYYTNEFQVQIHRLSIIRFEWPQLNLWRLEYDLEMTDYQYDLWELDKLSRKVNRCDPNRCSIWKRFLFRQDWNWPWMTERHVTVMWGQMRLCSINPRWQITILIKARYRSFAAQKGTLFIFIIKTTCFEAWTWTRTCPGHVWTFGLPRVGS